MKKQTSLITLSLLLATPAVAGGGGAPATRPAAACQTIAQIVSTDPQFSTLLTAVQAAGLTETLASGQYTVFAPTNAAFAKLPSDQLAMVLNDEEMLRAVLLYHVVPGKVSAQQVRSLRSAKTAQGANVTVAVSGTRVTINGANVTRADVAACNGVIHVIDTVLMPPMTAATPAPAPAPAAAAPAPAPVVTTPAPATPVATAPAAPATAFDVRSIPSTPLSGAATTTTTTETTTTTTDTATTTTDTATTDAAATTTETVAVATNTVYDVIVADARFSTLLDLLSDAGLTETLTSGEYTIFAPTNEAFEALPAETLANLAANPEVLRQVLSYHVVQGRLTAAQLGAATTLNSVQGGALPLRMNGSMQMVGEASVSETVTTATNGTIFVINQVLLPPGLTIPAAEAVEAAPADAAATTTTEATTSTTTTTPAAPAATTPATATTPAPATAPASTTASATNATNLATLIATDARFTTLADLLQRAGLTQTLTSGEYTIFAPTNEAFAKLAPADLTALGTDAARLRSVLLYHVVPGRITATALASSPELTSVETGRLTLTRATGPDRTTIGTTTVSGTIAAGEPVTAGNGLLYVIDTVLVPPTR